MSDSDSNSEIDAGKPLPALCDLFEGNQSARIAYQRIFPREDQEPVLVRILGWMLIHAPSQSGRAHVAQCINACKTDQEILELGDRYLKHFALYANAKAHKPTSMPYQPAPTPTENIRPNTLSHRDVKAQALSRDNYRCMLSGAVDLTSYYKIPRLRTEAAALHHCNIQHIFPQDISRGHDDRGKGFNYSNLCSFLESFGGIPNLGQQLNEEGIHNLSNVLTLASGLDTNFDALMIWLEPVEGHHHKYTIAKVDEGIRPDLPVEVTFTSTSLLPLPDRRYLALHAACARVIHDSGAVECIGRLIREMKNTKVLAEDSSSGELLEYLYGESLIVA